MISEQTYQNAANKLGVQVAAIKAFATVESNGSGFLPDGTPKILYERHIMYKRLAETKGESFAVDESNQHPDLVNKKPFEKYATSDKQHDILKRAVDIDRNCALESCSWGMFQIMGFNWKMMGYSSIQEFVNAMFANEAAQLDAFIRFVSPQKALVSALKALDFDKAASIYNGPNYKRFNYADKMRKEFEKNGGHNG